MRRFLCGLSADRGLGQAVSFWRKRRFLRELPAALQALAEQFELSAAEDCTETTFAGLLWRAFPLLGPSTRHELGGLLYAAAADDCFEVSDWLESVRRRYAGHSEVLTLAQLLCTVWCAYGDCEVAAEGLLTAAAQTARLLGRTVELARTRETAPELLGVWLNIIKHRNALFEPRPAVFERLCCMLLGCIGKSRRESGYKTILIGFLHVAAEPGPAKAELIASIPGSIAGDNGMRLYAALRFSASDPPVAP